MCDPVALATLQAGQGASNMINQYGQAKVQQTQYKTKASVEDANASIIADRAKNVDIQAQLSEDQLRRESDNLRSAQITAMGASGIAIDSASFQNILDTTDFYEAVDISLMRQSAGYQKASILEEARQRRDLSQSYSDTAKQIGAGARRGLFVNALNTVSDTSTTFYKTSEAFNKYKLSNPTTFKKRKGRGYITKPI